MMTAREAQEYLEISNKKMAQLLANGKLPSEPDPLDKRVKLVRRADVERLKGQSRKNAA
jgi:hypothetical protein